jgi:hypothetical protein
MSKLSVVLIGEKLDLLISNREPGGQEPRQPAPRLDSLTFERSCPAYRLVFELTGVAYPDGQWSRRGAYKSQTESLFWRDFDQLVSLVTSLALQ